MRNDIRKISSQLDKVSVVGLNRPSPKREVDLTVYDLTMGESASLGSKSASISIVAFMDYECPYCPNEYEKLKTLVKESQGNVKLTIKHYPLSFHKQAPFAASAAELAKMDKGDEGFWTMSDMLFAHNKQLQIGDLRQYAQKLGLQMRQFDDVMADPNRIDALLAADKAEAAKCKVNGTPTVLINGLKLQDRSPEGYKKRIDEILSKQPAKTASTTAPEKAS
jgi:protein-disulfide isomerase